MRRLNRDLIIEQLRDENKKLKKDAENKFTRFHQLRMLYLIPKMDCEEFYEAFCKITRNGRGE